MTKLWYTENFESFHNEMKKFTQNTLINLKEVATKQMAFISDGTGMESKTFKGAKIYVGEVHLSIMVSLNRALDEYMRVLLKLNDNFQDTVDAGSQVKLETDKITSLNKDISTKVEDFYQAHSELKKKIDTCNADMTCMPLNGPVFSPIETSMNAISLQLNTVEGNMNNYDDGNINLFNNYHQILSAVRKAIASAKTSYRGADGALNYQPGAFGNSPEGQELTNANYQLEVAKLATLYEVEDGNLDNMADYANDLLQDPNRLEQELAYLKYLIENNAFPDKQEERSQLTAFYYLLILLRDNKKEAEHLVVPTKEDFRVNYIKLISSSKSGVELSVACQDMSSSDFENYQQPFVSDVENERIQRMGKKFVIQHFSNNIDAQVDNDENAKLREQMEADKGNWIIPIATTGVGALFPIYGGLFVGIEILGAIANSYSGDKRIEEMINKDELINTADKFGMTVTMTTVTTREPSTVEITMNPTPETKQILQRWQERAEDSGSAVEFPDLEKMDYIELHKYYMDNNKYWSDDDEKYIFGKQ
ncbi:hypothetical protein IA816_08015 [Listeria marthii]|uniref:hypothetical protein n=1 Tax=Listeria marthii TaxID=529731 RepID=UPI001887F453|nr:hypothetical protein [Listeria marthii]MBF2555735.1 hypothetical protein [Listeria marthii]